MIATGLASLAAPGFAAAAPGDLDPTFDGDGARIVDLGGNEHAAALAVRADGGVIVAGGLPDGGSQATGNHFKVASLSSAGEPDATFAQGGTRTVDFGTTSIDSARAVAIHPDGKIVLAGFSNAAGSTNDFAIARLNPNGSLDSSFGSGGLLITDFGGNDQARSLAIDSQGRLVAAGFSGGDFAVARYTPTGVADQTFAESGKRTIDFGSGDNGLALAIAPGGDIVIAGFTGPGNATDDFALARLQPDGALDPAFDSDGLLRIDMGATVQDRASSLAIDPLDGRIVVGGWTQAGPSTLYDMALARLLPSGQLDPNFGDGGRQIVAAGGTQSAAFGVAIAPDGKVITVGEANPSGFDFVVARLLAEGTLDPGFGAGGLKLVDLERSSQAWSSVGLAPDGGILTAGRASAATSNNVFDFAVAKLEGDPIDLDTQIDSGPPEDVVLTERDVELTFSSASPGVVGFECSWRGGSYEPCSSPFTRNRVADGTHTFLVRAVNTISSREPTPASRSFTIDTTAPWLQIRKRKLHVDRKGRGAVKLRCSLERSGDCEGSLVVKTVGKFRLGSAKANGGAAAAAKRGKRKLKTIRLAKRKYSFEADGSSRLLRLKIKGRKLRLLRADRFARKVSVAAKVRDQLGNKDRVVKEMKVVLAKRKRDKRR